MLLKKRQRGLTLLEVVLASTITMAMVAAFMGLYRSQQVGFQVALDGLRAPEHGVDLMSRITPFAQLAFAGAANWKLYSSDVVLPQAQTGTPWIELSFQPVSVTGSPFGSLKFTSNTGQTGFIGPVGAIASFSVSSPDLVSTCSAPTTVIATLSASLGSGGAPSGLSATIASGVGTFRYNGGPSTTVAFSSQGTFVLDGGTAGVLTCVWPTTVPPNVSTAYTVTLNPVTSVKRVIFGLLMATSAFNSPVWIRDSVDLVNF